jgi:hypothetical protein
MTTDGEQEERTAYTLAEAITLYLELRDELCHKVEGPDEVWTRGHSDTTWKLTPTLFREGAGVDETSLFHQFRVQAPDRHADHRTVFDWLCLMQHYGAPTRLLDWTENLMIALYFAVASGTESAKAERDRGRVYLLAPRALNHATVEQDKVFVSDGSHVAARSVLARARDYPGWLRELESQEYFPSSIPLRDTIEIPKDYPSVATQRFLSMPIAVRPNRFNERLRRQVGTFTLHGGKVYAKTSGLAPHERLPEPRCFEELTKGCAKPILRQLKVAKARIREDLLKLGINRGSVFPDLDAQAATLVEKWKFRD